MSELKVRMCPTDNRSMNTDDQIQTDMPIREVIDLLYGWGLNPDSQIAQDIEAAAANPWTPPEDFSWATPDVVIN